MLTYVGIAVALTGIAAFSYYRKSSSVSENNEQQKTNISEQQQQQHEKDNSVIIPVGQQQQTTITTTTVEKPTVVVVGGQTPSVDNSQIDIIGERLKVKPQALDTLNVVSKKTASGRIVSPRRKNVDREVLKKAIQEAEQSHVAEAI